MAYADIATGGPNDAAIVVSPWHTAFLTYAVLRMAHTLAGRAVYVIIHLVGRPGRGLRSLLADFWESDMTSVADLGRAALMRVLGWRQDTLPAAANHAAMDLRTRAVLGLLHDEQLRTVTRSWGRALGDTLAGVGLGLGMGYFITRTWAGDATDLFNLMVPTTQQTLLGAAGLAAAGAENAGGLQTAVGVAGFLAAVRLPIPGQLLAILVNMPVRTLNLLREWLGEIVAWFAGALGSFALYGIQRIARLLYRRRGRPARATCTFCSLTSVYVFLFWLVFIYSLWTNYTVEMEVTFHKPQLKHTAALVRV
jgi:hypothetical protein